MSQKKYDKPRPSIPAEIRRKVQVEAGHSCIIKFCPERRYLEIHHINGNRNDNRIENLALLCSTHHKMAHNKEIDIKSLNLYKSSLSISSHYSKYSEEKLSYTEINEKGKDIQKFVVEIDKEGLFVNEEEARSILFEAAIESGIKSIEIEILAEPIATLKSEIDLLESIEILQPSDRETLVSKRKRLRELESNVDRIKWCMNTAIKYGDLWHYNKAKLIFELADYLLATITYRRINGIEKSIGPPRLEVFKSDQSAYGSFAMSQEETEILLEHLALKDWYSFVNGYIAPIRELPRILHIRAFAIMILEAERLRNSDITNSLTTGFDWGFGPA